LGRVVHFELNADNPERAAAFYEKVLDWKVEKWSGPGEYWLVTTGSGSEPGINGAIIRRSNPGATTVNTIGVESMDLTLEKIVKKGGKVVSPKVSIPGVGWFAYCQDTEGNTFGVIQNINEDV
jgi:predicted enzyme related to lactoylglutathione lyase